jgi:hypothetical protein
MLDLGGSRLDGANGLSAGQELDRIESRLKVFTEILGCANLLCQKSTRKNGDRLDITVCHYHRKDVTLACVSKVSGQILAECR